MQIVGVVTARGGSKGIPGKNVKPMAGKPMIAWTIEAALAAGSVSRVIVSTDCNEIAELCKSLGAEVPFLRPPHLARSSSLHIDVMLHALDWVVADNGEPDYLMLLQPTTPLRTCGDIEGAIAVGLESQAENVVSVCECEPHPWLALHERPDKSLELAFAKAAGDLRRQVMPKMWFLNGAIYLNSPRSLRSSRSFFPAGTHAYHMPHERSIDVDTPLHFFFCEQILRARHAKEF